MEFSLNAQLAVPVSQMALLLAISTTALLFRKIKLALITNYLFTLYWGYVFNKDLFGSIENLEKFTLIYFGFGLAVIVLVSIALLAPTDQYGS